MPSLAPEPFEPRSNGFGWLVWLVTTAELALSKQAIMLAQATLLAG